MSLTVEKCLQAWTNSLRQMNAKADIVFFGDSLTYYGDFSSAFPDKVVCNLGLRGDTIRGLIERTEQIKILEPRKIYLMAGINDIASISIKEFADYYERLIDTVSKANPEGKLIIQNIAPINDKDFSISCNHNHIMPYNRAISLLARKHDLSFIDIYSILADDGLLPKDLTVEGIHFTSLAYSRWYDILKANNIVEL